MFPTGHASTAASVVAGVASLRKKWRRKESIVRLPLRFFMFTVLVSSSAALGCAGAEADSAGSTEALSHAAAAEVYDGAYTDHAGHVTRVIERYRVHGAYEYRLALQFGFSAAEGDGFLSIASGHPFAVKISMNSQAIVAKGLLTGEAATARVYQHACPEGGWDDCTASERLFQFAVNGHTINAWDVSYRVGHSDAATGTFGDEHRVRFPQLDDVTRLHFAGGDGAGTVLARVERSGDGDQGSFSDELTVLAGGAVQFSDNSEADFQLDPAVRDALAHAARGLTGNLRSTTVAHEDAWAASRDASTFRALNAHGALVTFETDEYVQRDASGGNRTVRKDVDSDGTTASSDGVVVILGKVRAADVTPGDLEGRPDAEALCHAACEVNAERAACEVRLGCRH
jgi:hypothetical protein